MAVSRDPARSPFALRASEDRAPSLPLRRPKTYSLRGRGPPSPRLRRTRHRRVRSSLEDIAQVVELQGRERCLRLAAMGVLQTPNTQMQSENRDVARGKAEQVAGAPHLENMRPAPVAVLQPVHRRARFAGFGARAGRVTPGLGFAGARRCPRAALQGPSLGSAFGLGTNRLAWASLQATDHARRFLLSSFRVFEFFEILQCRPFARRERSPDAQRKASLRRRDD